MLIYADVLMVIQEHFVKQEVNISSFQHILLTFDYVLDYCLPTNPCLNGGRCTSTGSSYTCDCSGTGYTGPLCNELIVASEF